MSGFPGVVAPPVGAPSVLILESPTSPAFVEQPTIVEYSPGRWLAAWRYTASGSDTSGQGVIHAAAFGVTDPGPVITQLSPIVTLASDATLDCRGARLDKLADGRLILIFTTGSTSTGNPNGMGTGPDGLTGNNRYILCPSGTDPTNPNNWGSQHTIVSGFNTSNGFDSTCYCTLIEPTPGTLVMMVVGSNTVLTWNNQEIIGCQIGTYSPGGAISWGVYSTNVVIDGTVAGATQGHVTGEASLAITSGGNWNVVYRDSAASQCWQTTLTGPVTIPGGVVTGSGGWSAPAVTPGVGTLCFANPCQTVFADGKIVFPSRSTLAGHAVFAYSTNSGVAWATALFQGPSGAFQGYLYGQIRERTEALGQAVVTACFPNASAVPQIVVRWEPEGALTNGN